MRSLLYGLALLGASAAHADTDWSVYGAGNASCGAWTSHTNDPVMRGADLGWLAGFVSGHNLVTSATGIGNSTSDLDFNALRAWMDKRCQDRPLESVAVAGRELAKALLSRESERP